MKIVNIFFMLIFCFSCSTVSNKIVYEATDIKQKAVNLRATGYSLLKNRDFDKALEYFKGALKYNTITDNTPGIITVNGDIGNLYNATGSYDAAIEYFNNAINIFANDNGYKKEMGYIYHGIGDSYRQKRAFDSAEKNYKEALIIYKEFNMPENEALVTLSIGKNLKSSGKDDDAVKYILDSIGMLEKLYKEKKLRKLASLSDGYYIAGNYYLQQKIYDKSLNYFTQALSLDKLNENSSGIAGDYAGIGKLHLTNNNKDAALYNYEKSRDIYMSLNFIDDFIKNSWIIANLYQDTGKYTQAILNYGYIYNAAVTEKDRNEALISIKNNIAAAYKLALINKIQVKELNLKYGIK